jgi:hypothetical protein
MTLRESTHRGLSEHAEKRYWFPAKRYGWGWSFPATWQGWLVLAVYFVLILGAIPALHPEKGAMGFGLYSLVVTLGLFAVCWWKGEPLRWRWGKK